MTRVFLDHNATCPLTPEHIDAVAAVLRTSDGNPSSIHESGRKAKVALEDARKSVAALLGARDSEVTFTSGATEANNLVLRGIVFRGGFSAPRPHIVVTAAEHSSVIETAQTLQKAGWCSLDLAPVDRFGRVDRSALLSLIRPDTALVALILVNNEVGSVNPVADLAREIRAKSKTVHIHTDAVQGLGKIDLRWLASSPCDSAAFSAHKIGAFKGTGALWLRPGVKLATWMTGGGQERSKRAGTENLPGIVSFGLACKEIGKDLSLDATWFEKPRGLQLQLLKGLAEIPGCVVHGDPATGVANTVNFHVEGVAGDDILLNLDLEGFAASSGSACSSGVGRPSHVLKAMGWSDDIALGSVRISFGSRGCTGDVDRLITVLKGVVKRLQSSGAGKVRGSSP